jgi:hypothetical protein
MTDLIIRLPLSVEITPEDIISEEQIPTLPASKIRSGQFHIDRIPPLPADRVTEGVFDPERIPDLDATKVKTGQFNPEQIPDLDASKLKTGTIDPALLGLGENVQQFSNDLEAIAALTTDDYGRNLLTLQDAAATRDYIGAAPSDAAAAELNTLASTALQPSDVGSTIQPYDAALAAIAALSTTEFGRNLLTAEDPTAARAAIDAASSAVGMLATTALQPSDVGSTIQPYDADLAAIATLDTTEFGRDLLALADAAAVRAAIGAASDSASSGKLLQIVAATPITATQLLTVTIPCDDTIPQQTEGTEIWQLSITPQSASSTLIFSVTLNYSQDTGGSNVLPICALFAGSASDAIRAIVLPQVSYTNNLTGALTVRFSVPSPGTSATTYKIRVGANSGKVGLNGYISAGAVVRRLGGVMQCTLEVMEIAP